MGKFHTTVPQWLCATMRSTLAFKEPGIAVVVNMGLGGGATTGVGVVGRVKGGLTVLVASTCAKGACCATLSFVLGTTVLLIPGAGDLGTVVAATGAGAAAPLQVSGGIGPLPS